MERDFWFWGKIGGLLIVALHIFIFLYAGMKQIKSMQETIDFHWRLNNALLKYMDENESLNALNSKSQP